MSRNTNLSAAKNAKNDEFYTQYADIQKEVNAYLDYDPDVFRDKTVLLPCDDPEWSNFTKFFAQNFERFGLKKLVSTSYAIESKVGRGVLDAPHPVGSRVPRDRDGHSRVPRDRNVVSVGSRVPRDRRALPTFTNPPSSR